MTEPLYLSDPYRRSAPGTVTGHTDAGGVVLDASRFYATGGGQPSDRGRLVRIGTPEDQVDLQPCGGTHVARTGKIGRLRIGKIEKKGRLNRRVNLHLEG